MLKGIISQFVLLTQADKFTQELGCIQEMCILFALWVRDPNPNGYRLILISNRDEFFGRPAAKATSWPHAPHIFGGMDMKPEREGGTWLGMDTKEGRIGVLLNVTCTSAMTCSPRKGRGPLVTNWLLQNVPARQYLNEIQPNGTDYSGFHLITFDLRPQGGVGYYSNSDTNGVRFLEEGIIALGNSPIDRPFRKVKEGKRRFQEIVHRFGSKENEKTLIDNLLSLLKWQHEHLPDPEIELLKELDEERKRWTSSLFQRHTAYGTRTHTIILVDTQWNCQFNEWTLQEPIDVNTSPWLFTKKDFVLPHGN